MPPHSIPNPLQLLERALAQGEEVIAAISANQARWRTPCQDWTVQDLLHHLVVADLHNFTLMARGTTVDPEASRATVGADWSTRFGDGASMLMRAWRGADLNRQVALPGGGESPLRGRIGLQIAEFTVHAWDLSIATGVPVNLDPALAEQSLAWSQRVMRAEYRGPDKPFGAEVRVSADADVYAQLAGWFGRDPDFPGPGRPAP